jgi:FlaA1/EpsC-like NDP-sugar epimerase
MKLLDLPQFISTITGRNESLLKTDLENNHEILSEKINGKSVLVIGGAGTIGSNYIKALLKFKPSKLYVIDINENGLTELVRDIRSSEDLNIPNDFITYPINFSDKVFEKILAQEKRFDIIANFAAHKHVRSEKDHFSIEAMVDNNVIKAKRLLDVLLVNPPNHFFCVSTDKAANPVNVMGASKKLMEEVVLAYSDKMPITTARFANVAFSNGSLLFGFLERLMKRQPLSSPLDIKRYFVSPQESGELCLLACMLGESGDIFFPKLNPEDDLKTFADIATRLLAEYDLEPDFCQSESEARQKAAQFKKTPSVKYPVLYFSSDTSGEKPYEEFFVGDETIDWQKFKALGVIKDSPKRNIVEINTIFNNLNTIFESGDINKQTIVNSIKDIIPNFEHIEKGKGLDQKM